MRLFLLFLATAFLSVFSTNASALETQSLTNKTLNNQYTALQKRMDTRYSKIYPFKSQEYEKITILETAVENAYKKADATPVGKSSLSSRQAVRKSVLALNQYVATLEKSRKTAKSAATVIPAPVVSPPATTNTAGTSADILYYADSFEWARTSLGDGFKQSGFSAARCNVPLGTLLQVQYGGKSVIVKANDRPNCDKHPDIVDTTREAFSSLASLGSGRLKGSFVPLGTITGTKEYLPSDFFSAFHVQLDSKIPNIALPNETVHISGKVTDGGEETILYVVAPSGKSETLSQDVKSGSFDYPVTLEEVGNYQFVVASGLSFSQAKWLSIRVMDPSILEKKQYFKSAIPNATGLRAERIEGGDLSPIHVLNVDGLGDNVLRNVKITNGSKTIERMGMGPIAFAPNEFSIFKKGEKVHVEVTARLSSTPFSMDTYSDSVQVLSDDYVLSDAFAVESHESVTVSTKWSVFSATINSDTVSKIRSEAYVITPSGSVDHVPFVWAGDETSLSNAKGARLEYAMKDQGAYLLEIMYENGFPAYLAPVSYGKSLAMLPNAYDLVQKEIHPVSNTDAKKMVGSINAIRSEQGLGQLQSDDTLSTLAQIKAADMANGNYVWHVDSEGEYIDGTAKRNGIKITTSIGENVAGGTVSAEYLQAGLSLSGGHRSNMLGKWNKLGIGIVVKNGRSFVCQVFGE